MNSECSATEKEKDKAVGSEKRHISQETLVEYAYIMDKISSVDIYDEMDFVQAEAFVREYI